jgi:hypothetical protein
MCLRKAAVVVAAGALRQQLTPFRAVAVAVLAQLTAHFSALPIWALQLRSLLERVAEQEPQAQMVWPGEIPVSVLS